jgi:hypothetical protein
VIFLTFSSLEFMQWRYGSDCPFIKWRNERSGHGIRTWQAPTERSMDLLLASRECASMRLIAPVALVAATLAGIWGTSALDLEEQAHDKELFVAYCIGVFGADQTSLKSLLVPVCLTSEPADLCSARIADIDQERHRMDLTLRRVQDSLAARGIIASERYTMTAKYLVASSCWEGM